MKIIPAILLAISTVQILLEYTGDLIIASLSPVTAIKVIMDIVVETEAEIQI